MNTALDHALSMEGKLRTTLRKFVGPWGHEEDDYLQEVYLKLHRHGEKFDPTKSAVNTFVYNVARNRAIQVKRKKLDPLHGAVTDDPTAIFRARPPRKNVVTRDSIIGLLKRLKRHGYDVEFRVFNEAIKCLGDLKEVAQRLGYNLSEVKSVLARVLELDCSDEIRELIA